jgi:GST-like protein
LLLPDGTVLTESAAILIHLGLAFPASGILPAPTSKRAQSIRGLVFIAANCYAAVGISDYPQRWCAGGGERAVEAVRRGARRRLHGNWELFADAFPARPYLAGPEPGGLDFLAAVVSKWSGARTHLRAARPEFAQTLERIETHPSVAPVFARHWPG